MSWLRTASRDLCGDSARSNYWHVAKYLKLCAQRASGYRCGPGQKLDTAKLPSLFVKEGKALSSDCAGSRAFRQCKCWGNQRAVAASSRAKTDHGKPSDRLEHRSVLRVIVMQPLGFRRARSNVL